MAIFGRKTVQMAERHTQVAARKEISARAGYKPDSIKNRFAIPASGTKMRG